MTTGPFLIKHTRFSKNFFIKINTENHEAELTGPGESDDAHEFFIRRVSEYSNYFEILSGEDQQLHLTAMVDWRGYGIHPPQLCRDANGLSYMAIYDQKSQPKNMKPEDPSKCGKDENEAFYISCYTKPAFSNDASYFIVNRETRLFREDVHYRIGCAPNIKHGIHDGEPMLFKFVKVQPWAQPLQEEEQEDPLSCREHHIASDNDDGDPIEGGYCLGTITRDVTERPS